MNDDGGQRPRAISAATQACCRANIYVTGFATQIAAE